MIEWSDPWAVAQVAYVPVGIIAWAWAMGMLFRRWESPALRLAIALLNPRRVEIPRPLDGEAVLVVLSGFVMVTWLFLSFLLWPITAAVTLTWNCRPRQRRQR